MVFLLHLLQLAYLRVLGLILLTDLLLDLVGLTDLTPAVIVAFCATNSWTPESRGSSPLCCWTT